MKIGDQKLHIGLNGFYKGKERREDSRTMEKSYSRSYGRQIFKRRTMVLTERNGFQQFMLFINEINLYTVICQMMLKTDIN